MTCLDTNTDSKPTTDKHPSGLTWERWNQPFKMPHERKMIQQWYERKYSNYEFDTSIPF